MKAEFKITRNKGFQMTFENGFTISVQFGYGNYCENNHHPDGIDFAKGKDVVESSTAEIAIWDENQVWYDFGDDVVKGWVKPDEVAEWITKVSQFKKVEVAV